MNENVQRVLLDGAEVSDDEFYAAYQELIDSGSAWHLEGAVGRLAMDLIRDGACVLGPRGHRDAYGNYVPSRNEVESGSCGSLEYARERHPEVWAND